MYRLGVETADEMFGAGRRHARAQGRARQRDRRHPVRPRRGPGAARRHDDQRRIEDRGAARAVDGGGLTVTGRASFRRSSTRSCWAFEPSGRSAGFEARGRDLAGAATVEDIAPTLLDLVHVPGDPLSATGQSFAPLLRGEPGVTRVGRAERVRFTETDLRVLPSTDGGVDEIATAKRNSKFFEVSSETGRMSVREDSCRCRWLTRSARHLPTTCFLRRFRRGRMRTSTFCSTGRLATDGCFSSPQDRRPRQSGSSGMQWQRGMATNSNRR